MNTGLDRHPIEVNIIMPVVIAKLLDLLQFETSGSDIHNDADNGK